MTINSLRRDIIENHIGMVVALMNDDQVLFRGYMRRDENNVFSVGELNFVETDIKRIANGLVYIKKSKVQAWKVYTNLFFNP